VKNFYPIIWLLLVGAILALDYATGSLLILAPLLFFPVALASWFNGRLWGLALAIGSPLALLGFHFGWASSATLAEAIANAGVKIVTFSTFAVLIDLVARQKSEIRVLKGFLPTCAWCRKIQDAEGHWSPIELYITRHTEAKFSHGICPECAKKNFAKSDG
jgi:hypothetical protein